MVKQNQTWASLLKLSIFLSQVLALYFQLSISIIGHPWTAHCNPFFSARGQLSSPFSSYIQFSSPVSSFSRKPLPAPLLQPSSSEASTTTMARWSCPRPKATHRMHEASWKPVPTRPRCCKLLSGGKKK